MNTLLTSGLVALGLIAAAPLAAQETIRFAVTDIDGMEALQREMGPFKAAFEAASGLKVEFFSGLGPHRGGRGDGRRSGRFRADRPGGIRRLQRPS
ncbi:MAG: hypothetical protein V4753_15295 [Pseudomonadota bacterium]